MLSQAEVIPIVHVSDLDRARRYYTSVLGLVDEGETDGGNVKLIAGEEHIELMVKPDAVSDDATVLSFEVEDVPREVNELMARGVSFEPVDVPGGQRDGVIVTMAGERAAWFKDSEGNWLCLHDEHG